MAGVQKRVSCAAAGAAIGSGTASLAMAAAGAAVAYAGWVALMFALIPVLLWLALGTAPFVALA